MSTRIRENANSLFDTYIEINMKKEPFIEFCIPENLIENKEICATYMGFCIAFIPSTLDCRYGSQFYTFVQTEIDSKFKFGFCCYSPLDLKIRCFVSYNPYFTLFNSCFSLLPLATNESIIEWVKELYKIANISPYKRIENLPVCDYLSALPCLIVPNIKDIPLLDNAINISTIMKRIDLHQIIQLYVAAILERRILIVSKKISLISAVVHSIVSIIYPLAWENVFIPLLPEILVDYLEAPMPFIIGIHKSIYEKTNVNIAETVLMDLDENILIYPPEFEALDQKLIGSKNINKLFKALSKKTTPEEFSDVFVRFQANIFGYYTLCLTDKSDAAIFLKDKFIEIPIILGRKNIELLKHLIQSQSFNQFIEHKISNINKEKPDTFDNIAKKISQEIKEKLTTLGYELTITLPKTSLTPEPMRNDEYAQMAEIFNSDNTNNNSKQEISKNIYLTVDENIARSGFIKRPSLSASKNQHRLNCIYIKNESQNAPNSSNINTPPIPKPRKLNNILPLSNYFTTKFDEENLYIKFKNPTDISNMFDTDSKTHFYYKPKKNHYDQRPAGKITNEAIEKSQTTENKQINELFKKTASEKSYEILHDNQGNQILEKSSFHNEEFTTDNEKPLTDQNSLSQRRLRIQQLSLPSADYTKNNLPIVRPRPFESKTFIPKPSQPKIEQIHHTPPIKQNTGFAYQQPQQVGSIRSSSISQNNQPTQKTIDIRQIKKKISLYDIGETEDPVLNKIQSKARKVIKPLPAFPPHRPIKNSQFDKELSNILEKGVKDD